MTPKDKAKEICNKFSWEKLEDGYKMFQTFDETKRCALIAVELHLEELSKMKLIFSDRELHYKYWQEVKQEINNL